MAEVNGKGVLEGMEVIIGEGIASDAERGDTTDPFMPKLFRYRLDDSKGSGGSTPK